MTTHTGIRHHLLRALAVLGLAATLGGCIVVPLGGPGYYRPHYYRYW